MFSYEIISDLQKNIMTLTDCDVIAYHTDFDQAKVFYSYKYFRTKRIHRPLPFPQETQFSKDTFSSLGSHDGYTALAFWQYASEKL